MFLNIPLTYQISLKNIRKKTVKKAMQEFSAVFAVFEKNNAEIRNGKEPLKAAESCATADA